MPYLKNRVQVYHSRAKQYCLIDTSVDGWKLIGASSVAYKRVKHHIPTGGARIEDLEVMGVASRDELAKLQEELGLATESGEDD